MNCTFVQLLVIKRILRAKPQSELDTLLSQLHSNENANAAANIITSLLKQRLISFFESKQIVELSEDELNLTTSLFKLVIKIYHDEYINLTTLAPASDENVNQDTSSDNDDDNDNSNTATITRVSSADGGNGNVDYYKCQLFNQNDLIPKVFRFLDLRNLNNCCLISIVWLIHSFNINSIYEIYLTKLLHVSNIRIWQRFVNARRVCYYGFNDITKTATNVFWKGLLMFQNVEYLKLHFTTDSHDLILTFMKILCKLGPKIKDFGFGCSSYSTQSTFQIAVSPVCVSPMNKYLQSKQVCQQLAKFNLYNAQNIRLDEAILPNMVISKKCETLVLESLYGIEHSWCMNLIDNCDLSGVTRLFIDRISIAENISQDKDKDKVNFDDTEEKTMNAHDESTQSELSKTELLEKLAAKFTNLKLLVIAKPIEDSLLFWKGYTNAIIKKTKMKIKTKNKQQSGKKDTNIEKNQWDYPCTNDVNVGVIKVTIYNYHVQLEVSRICDFIKTNKLSFQETTLDINSITHRPFKKLFTFLTKRAHLKNNKNDNNNNYVNSDDRIRSIKLYAEDAGIFESLFINGKNMGQNKSKMFGDNEKEGYFGRILFAGLDSFDMECFLCEMPISILIRMLNIFERIYTTPAITDSDINNDNKSDNQNMMKRPVLANGDGGGCFVAIEFKTSFGETKEFENELKRVLAIIFNLLQTSQVPMQLTIDIAADSCELNDKQIDIEENISKYFENTLGKIKLAKKQPENGKQKQNQSDSPNAREQDDTDNKDNSDNNDKDKMIFVKAPICNNYCSPAETPVILFNKVKSKESDTYVCQIKVNTAYFDVKR